MGQALQVVEEELVGLGQEPQVLGQALHVVGQQLRGLGREPQVITTVINITMIIVIGIIT